MKMLITSSGGTKVSIDKVKQITNTSRRTFGSHIGIESSLDQDDLKNPCTGASGHGFTICVAVMAVAFVLVALAAIKHTFAEVNVAEQHFRPSAAR